MNQTEFNKMFYEAVKSAGVEARDETGRLKSGAHPLSEWLEAMRVHTAAKHSDGEHTHEATVTLK